jgi:hypothetical protein
MPRCDRDPSRRSTVAIFGRGPAPAAPAVAPDLRSGLSAAGPKPGWTGSRAPRGAVRAAAAGRHSLLRLKDRLRTTPLLSQDMNLIARIRYVVNSVVAM